LLRQDAQSAQSRFASIIQLTKTITNVPFACRSGYPATFRLFNIEGLAVPPSPERDGLLAVNL